MFFYFIIIILIIMLLLAFAKIKIKIENVNISTERILKRHINKNYKLTISVYILAKIPILKIKITKDKLENLKVKNKIQQLDVKLLENKEIFNIDILKTILKNLKIKIQYLNLKLEIGTEDAALTSYIVALISAIIGILLKKQLSNHTNKFIVNPVYINKNLLKMELNCIFMLNMIHIIYIIYILKKKRRDDKNGRTSRTSDRRAYGYSYE